MAEAADRERIRSEVRSYILEEFLPGEESSALTDTTPLVSSGVLDSIANAKLVTFLEQQYEVRFSPKEIGPENLDTVDRIVDVVEAKSKS